MGLIGANAFLLPYWAWYFLMCSPLEDVNKKMLSGSRNSASLCSSIFRIIILVFRLLLLVKIYNFLELSAECFLFLYGIDCHF